MERRNLEEKIFKGLMLLSTMVILSSLVLILLTVLVKGLPYLSLAMVTQVPQGGYYLGKGGGILNAIVGSLYLAGGATIPGHSAQPARGAVPERLFQVRFKIRVRLPLRL